MAEVARVVETASSPMPATAVDVSGGGTVEALQTLEVTGSQAALVMTEGDDSVFYSEDEEIPQEMSICAPRPVSVGHTWLTQPQPSPEIQDSGGEEYEPLTQSPGLMEAGSEHHSGAMAEDMENLMENQVNHASVPDQGVESETETASKNSTNYNEELAKSSKVHGAVSATDEAAQFPVRDRSRLVHIVAETLTESQSEQPTETQERGKQRGIEAFLCFIDSFLTIVTTYPLLMIICSNQSGLGLNTAVCKMALIYRWGLWVSVTNQLDYMNPFICI